MKWCPAERHKGDNPVPLSAFSTDPGKADGLASWCRECANAAARDRHASNPGRSRAAWQRYQATLRALRQLW